MDDDLSQKHSTTYLLQKVYTEKKIRKRYTFVLSKYTLFAVGGDVALWSFIHLFSDEWATDLKL